MKAARLYRCNNCVNFTNGSYGVDFVAPPDAPVCPICGADKRERDESSLIDELVVIHYEPVHPKAHRFPKLIGTKGAGVVACQPGKPHHGSNMQVTGDPGVANCPACKATEAYQNAVGHVLNPKFDLPVGFTEEGDLQFLPNVEGVELVAPMIPTETK